MAQGNRAGGRILPSHRQTDDSAPSLGVGVALEDAHAVAIEETEARELSDKSRKDYRRRIGLIIKWLEEKYPDYYCVGTRNVSQEELSTPSKYHLGHQKDLIYRGLRADLFKAFLSDTKVKRIDTDGKVILKSVQDLRKYGDAIMFGAKMAGERLPMSFYEENDRFKNNQKESTPQGQKNTEKIRMEKFQKDQEINQSLHSIYLCSTLEWAEFYNV